MELNFLLTTTVQSLSICHSVQWINFINLDLIICSIAYILHIHQLYIENLYLPCTLKNPLTSRDINRNKVFPCQMMILYPSSPFKHSFHRHHSYIPPIRNPYLFAGVTEAIGSDPGQARQLPGRNRPGRQHEANDDRRTLV